MPELAIALHEGKGKLQIPLKESPVLEDTFRHSTGEYTEIWSLHHHFSKTLGDMDSNFLMS